MTDLERLLAIEDIRQLKARYWQGVDQKNEAMIRSVFADDAVIDYRAESYPPDQMPPTTPPPDAFARRCIEVLSGFVTVHHGHQPQIRFVGEDEAEATWPMEDNLWATEPDKSPYAHLQGFGFYHDRYRRTADGWRISATTLERLKVIRR